MKFSIDRAALLEPLQIVASVVERRQTLPILANLLLVVDEKALSLTGTDLEVELCARTDLVQTVEPGEITVPSRKLLEICRSLPDSVAMEFRTDGNRLGIHSGRFSSHLATLSVTDFPKVEMAEEEAEFSVSARALHELLIKTSFAMAQQDVRYYFNGLLFETVNNSIRLVATNGQRLASSFLDDIEVGNDRRQFIVPRKGVSELLKLIPENLDLDVRLRFSSNHMQVQCANATLTTKLIDATYPDYDRVIPEDGDKVLIGDRQEIKEALARTAILSNEIYKNIHLRLESGTLTMHSNNPQQEEAEESVSVNYNGPTLEIGFNVIYFIDALSAMNGEKVRMSFGDSNSACLLADPEDINSTYVIVPMVL